MDLHGTLQFDVHADRRGMTRVVLEFTSDASGDDADWLRVEQLVDSVGGANLRMPHPELPGIATFDIPDDSELEPVLTQLREIGSVSRVEAEAWREATGEPGATVADTEG